MPAKAAKTKRLPKPELNRSPAAEVVGDIGAFAELYPEFKTRIVDIWNSDVPFVKEKVARFRIAFEKRAKSWNRDLCERFGLTDAEASVAVYIIEGGSVDGYARLAKCSQSTVRSHLKSVFRKTGFSRQSQLATLFIPVPVERRP